MSIKGGWDTTLWYGGDPAAATNLGVVTRPDPIFDPALINVRGTGSRGLRNIVLGGLDPRLTLEIAPPDTTFLRAYQTGSEIATLHYRIGSDVGITLNSARINRISVSCRAGDILRYTAEFWGTDMTVIDTGCPWSGSEVSDVLDWTNFIFARAPKDDPSTLATISTWHEWRYEIVNNLERLLNLTTKGTRILAPRHREVSGLIVMDLDDMAEYLAFVGSDAEEKFRIRIRENANNLLGGASGVMSQWGRLASPYGPEDLQLKRYPFTCLDVS